MVNQQESFNILLLAVQVVFIAFFVSSTTLEEEGFRYSEYIIFRDIMAMLLLGFGYLMTFLKYYGLGAVGFTMILTAVAMQANIIIEYAMRAMYFEEEREWPLHITMINLIDAEFAAATLLITFGALIGRASPLQMLVLTLFEAVFYALNKAIMVFGVIEAEDVGGTLTIHMFGAYFGLAASYALGPPEVGTAKVDRISDVFAFVGTTILWVYWPSFVGATETADDVNEMRCVSNTIFSLMASTAAAFYTSHLFSGLKFDPVDIANATLAGGVAIGASARLVLAPGGAVVVGALAGFFSVVGYHYVSPMLECSSLVLFDTCGVGNLHGIPSIVGGVASAVFIHMNSDAEFLLHDNQIGRQFAAIFCTLGISIVSGLMTGKIIYLFKEDGAREYRDKLWWTADYFDASRHSQYSFGDSRHSLNNFFNRTTPDTSVDPDKSAKQDVTLGSGEIEVVKPESCPN